MTNKEKETENKIIGGLKIGNSAYNKIPEANAVIRVSSHLPAPDKLASKSPTKDYDNVFWVVVRDFINYKYSELDKKLFEAVNLIDSGDVETGKAVIKGLLYVIKRESGKNIAYSIIGAAEGEITAEVKSVRKRILTFGFLYEY